MVQLTAEAAAVLDEVKRAYKIPRSHGLRFFREEEPEAPEVSITFAEGPERDDAVTRVQNTEVFVAPEVADRLEGASLEAKAGERPVLVIKYPGEA